MKGFHQHMSFAEWKNQSKIIIKYMSRKMTYRSEKFHKTAVTDTDYKCFPFFMEKGKWSGGDRDALWRKERNDFHCCQSRRLLPPQPILLNKFFCSLNKTTKK